MRHTRTVFHVPPLRRTATIKAPPWRFRPSGQSRPRGRLLVSYGGRSVRAAVYVDGFNLYKGMLEFRPELKWLDLVELAHRLLPRDEIVKVRYFTAPIKAKATKPGAQARQQLYWRALETHVPALEIHKGHFASRSERLQLLDADPGTVGFGTGFTDVPVYATVRRFEEKGSDVNLASHLLYDATRPLFDKALVISNDSDLREPIRLVASELNLPVYVVNPHPEQYGTQLSEVASVYRYLHPDVVGESQFPAHLTLTSGRQIRRPHEWSESQDTGAGGPTIEVSEPEDP